MDDADRYEPPVHDSGRALITDPSALKQVLDDEDVERALGRPPVIRADVDLLVNDALSTVRSWLARPCAWVPEPGPRHLGTY